MEKSIYTYSKLSAQTIKQFAALNYDLSKVSDCKFFARGLHDNFLIESTSQKYILRLYRNDWRSPEDAYFELELLDFLGTNNLPVAFPIKTSTGDLSFLVNSPEGKRVATLFNFADGQAPGNEISAKQGFILGKTVASMHQTSDSFNAKFSRQILDTPYLLDDSIGAIKPFIDAESRSYLTTLQSTLKDLLPQLSRETGIYGVCSGDINPNNFHINDNNKITLFDFDQCGYGYRAFEIGKFISSIHSNKNKQEIAKAFINGYQCIRQLDQSEIEAIPYFEIIAMIWVMAIHAYNADHIGYKWLEKSFWDRKLATLKALDKEMFGGI